MDIINFKDRSVDCVVDQYVDSRRNSDWPISVAGAVKAVRMVAACQQFSDEQLGSIVMAAAVAKGRNIAFDLRTAEAERA